MACLRRLIHIDNGVLLRLFAVICQLAVGENLLRRKPRPHSCEINRRYSRELE